MPAQVQKAQAVHLAQAKKSSRIKNTFTDKETGETWHYSSGLPVQVSARMGVSALYIMVGYSLTTNPINLLKN